MEVCVCVRGLCKDPPPTPIAQMTEREGGGRERQALIHSLCVRAKQKRAQESVAVIAGL